ncbi:PREDICTED: tryptase-like [Cyprinodon variegatus]|uniref:tryptase-like n=1 Tax=Cyprinodon variegatus TaxID=28743 RepID=UPI000742C11D|nr:PREDICTED: tryptase-like [Cyprinodon variegatus]
MALDKPLYILALVSLFLADLQLLEKINKLFCLFPDAGAQPHVCGIARQNHKIVGGEDASPKSWPWQVDLQRSGTHWCGGSLISKKWVLTAAHCVTGTEPFIWEVFLGRQKLTDGNTKNEVSRKIGKIVVHPRFNSITFDNDIALLRLSSSVKFTDYIRPVCLAERGSTFSNGTTSWVTGWGNVAEGVPLPYPKTLQEVKVPVIGNRQCNCLLGKGSVTDNMICAGVLPGGSDSCQGDSGGPMVSKQRSRWIQSGVVSFGDGCARPSLPGVYTRVSRYQSWINSNIRFNKPGFMPFASSGVDPDKTFNCW